MEKIKALVTIGYHYGELDWGKTVREEYRLRKLKEDRDIDFYQIKDSDVETGKRCKNSVEEVRKIVGLKGHNLWIDIHCGIGFTTSGIDLFYGWTKKKKKIIDEMKKLGAHAINLNRKDLDEIELVDNIGIPYILIDPYFKAGDYEKKMNSYINGLEKTLNLINQVYDVYFNNL